MKKTILAITLMLAALTAGAQTMYDALTFSQNNYYGTARSIGMGNAMTAVGGDLGSIGINPAGSAVYNYSQFTLSPNLTVSSMNASYSAYPVNGSDVYSNEQLRKLTRFSMPNVGATFNMQTGNDRGLVAVTYGFVVNGTNNYTNQMFASGRNDKTSYISSMAVNADGFDIDFLNGYRDASGGEIDDWAHAYYNADDRGLWAPWNIITNAQSGAIGTYGNVDDPSYYWLYIAATEGFNNTGEKDGDGNYIYDIFLGGPLDQSYGRRVTGSKYDALFNVGFNFNDKFFIGANFGLTNIDYNYDEYFKEAAVDPADFEIKYEDATTYFDGLRIGAAIQSPTSTHITEHWRHSTDVHYQNSNYDGSATSPEGEYSYTLVSPYRVNAGLAYTFFGMALISADYEMTDYSAMKFKDIDGYADTFIDVNNDIKSCMGKSHMVRIGAEFKPVPEMAVRAGYNFTTIPEYYLEGGVKQTLNDSINSFSVGLGYSSKGSFFADIAGRYSALTDEYISPYADYLSNVASPLILNKRDRFDITATIGWRF